MIKRIRITGAGIHGAPTKDNPTGELPVGFEFETAGDLPAGWVGRAVVVGDEPKQDSTFIVNEDDDSELGKARLEVAKSAQVYIEKLNADHKFATQAIVARAEKAEGDLQHAKEQIEVLNLKIVELEKPNQGGEATADEIKTAVGMLDANTVAHWTTTGLPAVDAVSEIVGKPVTRKAIEEAAPGVKRAA
jgi:hypothetical protein